MAIFLIFVVVSIVPLTVGETERSKLEDTLKKLERTVKFATNESILRNKIVRIKFLLDEVPVTYTIEYGQSANIVLPANEDVDKLSLREREAQQKVQKRLDSKFIAIQEFEDDNEPINESINIIGFGTTYYPELLKEGTAYIYFYPTGDKDNSIILLNTNEEMASLIVYPFEDRTKKEFFPFQDFELEDIDNVIERKAKELFDLWLRN